MATIACSGYNNKQIIFISKSNQGDDYLLHYMDTNQTIIYSNSLSTIQGYPSPANFTGRCSYDNNQSSILMVFESNLPDVSTTNSSSSTHSTFAQLRVNSTPSFTSDLITLQGTEIVSAVNIAAANTTPSIAFVSNKLYGTSELSLNVISMPQSKVILRLAALNESGLLAADVESNSVYLLQKSAVSEYRLTSQTYSSFAVSNSSTQGSASVISYNQIKYIVLYDQQSRQLSLYSHTPSLSHYSTLSTNISQVTTHRVTGTAEFKPVQTSAGHLIRPFRRKRDVPDWAVERMDVLGQTGCVDGQCVVVAVAGQESSGLPIQWIALVDEGDGKFNVLNITQETATPSAVSDSDNRLDGGAITGIVVGVLAFSAILLGALFFVKRKRNKIRSMSYKSRSYPFEETVPAQSVIIGHSILRATSRVIHGSSLEQIAAVDDRPDIRPLSYVEGLVDFAHLSDEEMLELEPEKEGPMTLFDGAYRSLPEEKVCYAKHAMRTFMTDNGRYCSVHYFTAMDPFVRAVHAVTCLSADHIMKSERAIVLNSTTPRYGYQYIWITSPTIPSRSLQALLFDSLESPLGFQPQSDNRIEAVGSALSAVHSVHTHGFVHLAIDSTAFYHDPCLGWTLGNFTAVQHTLDGVDQDIMALASVIYSIATKGLAVDFRDQAHSKQALEENVRDEPFRVLLDQMLSPKNRLSLQSALDYWRGIYP